MRFEHSFPNRFRLRRSASWILGALVTSVIVACADEALSDRTEAVSMEAEAVGLTRMESSNRSTAFAYHDAWRILWEDHITWTRMVIIGIFDDLPGNDAYVNRLLQNYEDMESALARYYGVAQAEVFGDLLKDHLLIAADILVAAKCGDSKQVDFLVAKWRANADALAAKMNELNPMNWDLEEAKAMWQEHLDVTLTEATTHLSADFVGELAAWEQVHRGGLQMADMFSRGVIHQFPARFRQLGCVP